MKLCKHFKCKEDIRDCMECYNGICDGCGYEGHQRCGCECCKYHLVKEDIEDCTYDNKAIAVERRNDDNF